MREYLQTVLTACMNDRKFRRYALENKLHLLDKRFEPLQLALNMGWIHL